MNSAEVKARHDLKMKSSATRNKISKTMSELRNNIGFSEEHKQNIKKSRAMRAALRSSMGLSFYDHPENMASRSLACYCILDTGERFEFESIKEAGWWWYNNFKPFGKIYSVATYQRKIEMSSIGKQITYGNPMPKQYKIISNIRWFVI